MTVLTGIPTIIRRSEAEIQADIRLALGTLPNVTLWRNNVGEAWQGKVVEHTGDMMKLFAPRRVQFGLCEGSADLVGLKRLTITPDMVGQVVGVFLGIEVKRPGEKPTREQRNWINFVTGMGGIAQDVDSPRAARIVVGLPPV